MARVRGLRLEGKKDATLLVWTIKRFDPPSKVRLPPSNGAGSRPGPGPAPLVGVGDKVKVGQKIAEPANARSVAVHASISGLVTALDPWIEIESDKQDQKIAGFGTERRGWGLLKREELRDLFQDLGLVDLAPEMIPVHVKTAAKIKTLVLDATEAEPYLTADHVLMMAHPLEILKGAEILRKSVGAEEIVIVTQENKLEAAELFKSKIYFLKWKHVRIEVLPTIYPPIFEKHFNIATAFAVYEAVVMQKPLIERAVTVGGECFVEPKNVWARLGTEFETLSKYARGLMRQPGKVVAGGPMAGKTQENFKAFLVPGIQGLLALPEEGKKAETDSCIRIGHCVESCPVEISPVMIALAAEQGLFHLASAYGADACIECGNCTYVCPSKRPMVELIRSARTA